MSEPDNRIIEPASFTRAGAVSPESRFTFSPVKAALFLLFVLLAAAALFMFNASAVKFNISPDVDRIEIEGFLPTYFLGERYLMLKGQYSIRATSSGYEELRTDIEVTGEAEQDFAFQLTKLPGVLSVTTTPEAGAAIFIDQVKVGVTPAVIPDVAAGTRDLYIVHERYLPYQTEVSIEGMEIRQEEVITLSPAWAMISLGSDPSGASVMLDDVIVGQTPVTFEVLQGKHDIALKKQGYKIWQSELTSIAEQDQTLDLVKLIKSDGKLTITTDPVGANITIGGRYRGQAPVSIALPPNKDYELVATRAGYEPTTRKLAVNPDEDQNIRLTLTPLMGKIRILTTPAGGTVFVDDKPAGSANQTLELNARRHKLRVELPGYASFTTEVVPQPGHSQQLNIVLQTEEQARVAAIDPSVTTSTGDILRFIIPGEMTMGAARREPGRRSNEIEKQVNLTRAFYLAEKEITNQTFKRFDPGHDSGLLGRALLSEDGRPVVNVSWEKAVLFCNWLSQKDGLPVAYAQKGGQWQLITPHTTGYRLPTEAEWSWAARYAAGNEPSRFPWGATMPPPAGAGNFADESAANMVPYHIVGYNDNFRGPAPPGTYPPNELGIYDLAGNVSEWISDYYSIESPRELLTDPTGPTSGEYYVIRGSNYTHGRFSELRWTFRDYGAAPRPDVGFRIARYLQ